MRRRTSTQIQCHQNRENEELKVTGGELGTDEITPPKGRLEEPCG
jgi:hypothetical protein